MMVAGYGVGKRARARWETCSEWGIQGSGGGGLEDDKGRGLSDEQQALQRHVCPIRQGEDSSSVATARGGAHMRTQGTEQLSLHGPEYRAGTILHGQSSQGQDGGGGAAGARYMQAVAHQLRQAQERVWGRRALWETCQKNSTRG